MSPTPPPQSPPSSRVQLEVAFLDADQPAVSADTSTGHDEHPHLTVLVVAAETDVRRYVRECLRERIDLRLIESASVTAAVALAANEPPDMLIVDEQEAEVVAILSHLRGIVLVDDVPHGTTTADTRLRLLARPFTADRLTSEVDRLLSARLR